MQTCNICFTPFEPPVYVSPAETSITSLCEIIPGRTEVFYCSQCGHLNTREVLSTEAYYDQDYKILIDSEEEDQLYQVAGEKQVFRSEHQANTLLRKVELRKGARVLDFGCAKGATLRRLTTQRPDIAPHLFDVSEMYVPFWERFLPSENWATYTPRPEWTGSFDLVMTFFALEHVTDARGFVESAASLLKEGGVLYGIVPNVYANLSDFVVVDHINHFSKASLHTLLQNYGLTVTDIDDSSHTGAFVFVARKSQADAGLALTVPAKPTQAQVQSMADYWRQYGERVQTFEQAHDSEALVCIYGSGFYGTSIAASLRDPERVACFVDRNPYRQGKTLLGRPIVAPEALPDEIDAVYVGLNPTLARDAIAAVACWHDREHDYCFP